jgi:endonuclease-3
MESLDKKQQRVKRIIAALKKTHPDARLALDFSSPLELLIALMLAAQARDDLVNAVTAEAFKKYRTAEKWAKQKPEKLEAALRQINFYRRKTAAIQQTCRALMDNFGGQVPDNLDDLLTLPGVGRKTANIVLGNGFGKPAIGVDTHVARLSQRLGLSAQKNPDKIEEDLVEIVPKRSAVKFCHLLQFHGRRVCAAKKPDCARCSISKDCPYPDKTLRVQ